MKNRLKYFQAASEAIIPLLGLIFWDWSIYFILLFYFLDLIVIEVFTYLKVKKIIQFQSFNYPFKTSYFRLMINSILVLIVIILATISVYFILPEIEFYQELIVFIEYKEVGIPIPQGYILLPLVLLGNWMQYQTTFIKTGEYRVLSWKSLILKRRKALFIAILGSLLAIFLAHIFTFPDYIYAIALIEIKFFVDVKLG